MKKQINRKGLLLWLPFCWCLLFIYVQLQPIKGLIGHDYNHQFARFLIGAAHFSQNLLDVPHYTASLCAGIPFFADPQSAYYSLPQFFTFFLDPLLASTLTVLIFYVLGYWGTLKLLRDNFQYSETTVHLSALVFILNGFAFSHLLVGHVTHHTFLLFPWLLGFLFKTPRRGFDTVRQAAGFSLIITYMFYSGGLHMLVVFSILTLLLLPYLVKEKIQHQQILQFVKFLLMSVGFVALTCSGKLIASVLYSKVFYPQEMTISSENIFTQVWRYFWFSPSTTALKIKFGRWGFGPWEYVGFVSKITLPALGVFLWLYFRQANAKRIAFGLGYAALIVFVLLVATGRGGNDLLPFLKHYHNPIKLLGAFIPLLTLVFAFSLHWLEKTRVGVQVCRQASLTAFFFLSILLCAEFAHSADFFVKNKTGVWYKYRPASEAYQDLKSRAMLPSVTLVNDTRGIDIAGLTKGETSLKCYEPLFGYRAEGLKSQVVKGSVTQVFDGVFNLNHPGCLIYPDYFGCKPWDRIMENEKEKFEQFRAGRTPSWGVPFWQNLLIKINFSFIALLILVFFSRNFFYNPRSER